MNRETKHWLYYVQNEQYLNCCLQRMLGFGLEAQSQLFALQMYRDSTL